MDSVVHFEIPADDMEKAKKFYKAVFGWKMTDASSPQMKYTMVETTESGKEGPKEPGAINGGISQRMQKGEGPRVVVDVKSIEATAKKIVSNGGKTLGQKMPVMDMGYYMLCMDCEGNLISLWEDMKK